MSEPRIRNIQSFSDTNAEVAWIHRQLGELNNLINGKLTDESVDFANLTVNTLKVKSSADDSIINYGGITQKDYQPQTKGYRINTRGDADFRYLYVDELHAKAFIADLEQALAGSQVIAKSVARLANAFTLPTAGNAGALIVEEFSGFTGNVFADGDMIRLRQFTRSSNTTVTVVDAWGTVSFVRRRLSSTSEGSIPVQQYLFTRSSGASAGTATGVIAKGVLALDYGVSGNGIYEVTTIDGANGANSPYSQVVTWTTHPYSGSDVKVRVGNLSGIYDTDFGGNLSGYGLYGDNVYLKGNIVMTNQGSISISGFNNDAGFITSASAGNKTYYQATAPTANEGDFWFDTDDYAMFRKGASTWNRVSVYMDGDGLYAGTITAGQITAGTLTAFTIQTDAGTAGHYKRSVLSATDNEMHFYDASNSEVVKIGEAVYLGSVPGILLSGGVLAFSNGSAIGASGNDIYIDPPATGKVLLSAAVAEISGNTVWHAGNDGTGSLLDADMVDGVHASSFLQSITKSQVEAVLTGTITSHDHSGVYAPAAQGAVFGDNGGTIYVSISSGGATTTALLLKKIEINSAYNWIIASS